MSGYFISLYLYHNQNKIIMLTEKQVKVQIIRNPNVTTSELNFNFKNPQKLGGLKREITVKRNALKKLANSSNYTHASLGKKLGISVYALSRFLNKETNNPINAEVIYDALYLNDLNDLNEQAKQRFSGINKINIRYKFFQLIAKSKRLKGRFFTLPSETCTFENELNINVENKFHYIGAEHDKNVYLEALQSIAKYKLSLELHLGKAKNIILKVVKSDFFAHAFLDYCGTFPTYEAEIRHLITNNLVIKGGLIGLTFTTREANTKNQTSIEYHKAVLDAVGSKDTPTTIGGIKLKLLAFMGNNYKFEEIIDYSDDGSHMVFVLIKRVK